jgi:hypothetical protein
MPDSYNPNSPHAMFSRIMEQLAELHRGQEEHTREVCERFDQIDKRFTLLQQKDEEILTQALKTNGRVNELEKKNFIDDGRKDLIKEQKATISTSIRFVAGFIGVIATLLAISAYFSSKPATPATQVQTQQPANAQNMPKRNP